MSAGSRVDVRAELAMLIDRSPWPRSRGSVTTLVNPRAPTARQTRPNLPSRGTRPSKAWQTPPGTLQTLPRRSRILSRQFPSRIKHPPRRRRRRPHRSRPRRRTLPRARGETQAPECRIIFAVCPSSCGTLTATRFCTHLSAPATASGSGVRSIPRRPLGSIVPLAARRAFARAQTLTPPAAPAWAAITRFQNLENRSTPFHILSTLLAPPASPSAWSVIAIREHVAVTSVAVLVEVRAGDEVRQHWGGSPSRPRGGPGRLRTRKGIALNATAGFYFDPRAAYRPPDTRAARMERDAAADAVAPARRAAADAARADAARAPGGVRRGELERRFDAQVPTRDVGRNADAAV